jgi:LIVCS family branched-chain amino acid:cation transporter
MLLKKDWRRKQMKLTTTKFLLLTSTIFGLFFGAGNLIFPVFLGQQAGNQWLPATFGFLMTGVILPLLALVALGLTNAKSLYDLAARVAPWFALFFTVLIHLTIGPFFATPRTAAISYQLSFGVFWGHEWWGLPLYSLLFFAAAYGIARLGETGMIQTVGKYLNPLFLILIFLLFLLALFKPFGDLATAPANPVYHSAALANGFLQGYNTMDVMAALAFGVSVVATVKAMGVTGEANIAKTTAKGAAGAMALMAMIYGGLILLGAMSLSYFKPSDSGAIPLQQLTNHYFGAAGPWVLGILTILALLTTAVGLIAAFARDFAKMFPKVTYNQWLLITATVSFIVANAGLDKIISWSVPFLYLAYPLSLALVASALTTPLHHGSRWVYWLTTLGAGIFALFDALMTSPLASGAKGLITWYTTYVPLAAVNLAWLLPGFIGLVSGVIVSLVLAKPAKAEEVL